MRGSWVIPILFGILFFSTVFSAQNVYGPHFTTFDGIRHHYQGTGQSQFDVSILISEGLGNPKKNANFEVCVKLDTATDSFETEIVALNLVSCQPITVTGETDLNFLRVLVPVTNDPVFSPSMIVDISGSYEILNPSGKSISGEIEFLAEEVVLDILACIPPTCSGGDGDGCGPNGTCVADDLCKCDDGFHGEFCQFPDCQINSDCNDSDACTLDICRDDGTCAAAPIPGCDPNNGCTTNEQCAPPDECTVGFCNSVGNCQFEEIPGCVPQVPCDDPNCEECLPSNPNFCEQCRDGFIADENGQCGACDPAAVEVCTDGIDNDCDGDVDFSDDDCSSAELCDGKDNNDDGNIDEGFDLGESCKVGTGACESTGELVCGTFGDQICSASPGDPLPENNQESCTDGIDNDCDGLTDCDDVSCQSADLGETCSLPFLCSSSDDCDDGDVCTIDMCDPLNSQADLNGCVFVADPVCLGAPCQSDETICDDGNVCTLDVCDPFDPNADPNGCISDIIPGCTACTPGSSETCTTACGTTGSQICDDSGNFGTCNPPTEICNGVDDDCDGTGDNGFECTAGSTISCTTSCGTEGTATCSSACTIGTCSPPVEVCTDGVDNDCDTLIDSADPDCVTSAVCGDGSVDPGEECDNGAANSDTIPNSCRTNCINASCGDGVQDAGEVCDDGNASNNDSCTNSCLANVCGDGFVNPGVEQCDDGNGANGDGCSSTCTSEADAFRFTNLQLRDPHMFTTVFSILCPDVTNEFNDQVSNEITMDDDGDGSLDLNFMLLFRPLDQTSSNGNLDFDLGLCSPTPISCGPDPSFTPILTSYANQNSGTCLSPVPGTTTPTYAPTITEPNGPCFASPTNSFSLSLAGINIPLSNVQVASTYVGSPATHLNNGLLMGFLSESDADLIPVNLLNAATLSDLLPGSQLNCNSGDDRDDIDGDGIPDGWWIYFNYEAERVPWTEP